MVWLRLLALVDAVLVILFGPLFSAVVGILGLLLVPFIHLSVYLFRTLHPQPVVLKPSAPSLPPEMLRTLLISGAVFLLLYVGLVTIRYGLALAEEAEERGDAA
jgi:heme exporter protein C